MKNCVLVNTEDNMMCGKEFHYRFLSKALPVYLYSSYTACTASDVVPLAVMDVRGLLMRKYPSDYQLLLDHGNGKYTQVSSYVWV